MSPRTIIVTDRDFWPLSALVRAQTARFTRDKEHIDSLEEELARSVPVAPEEVPADVVTMHSRVRVRDLESGAERTYALVYPHEAHLPSGRLSVLAPLGTALLGYREGDEIEWAMPGGLRRIRIESVRQSWTLRAVAPARLTDRMKARHPLRRSPPIAQPDGVN
ncbi:MAG TPA: nucleoside diphosphate kinase regulator [Steroidobacteraceae bacterium]|nr:nucleoside diphosphate kinase regulator [Steroidobacteraceae bacterium]